MATTLVHAFLRSARKFRRFALSIAAAAITAIVVCPWGVILELNAQTTRALTQRPITVQDAIETTRLANPDYLFSAGHFDHAAQFSPDGRRFIVVLRKGNLVGNTNEYSIYSGESRKVFQSPGMTRLVTLSSSTNLDAISQAKWLADNETIAFLGVDKSQRSQVYVMNVRTRHLEKRTTHRTSITSFDINRNGSDIVFVANSEEKSKQDSSDSPKRGIVIGKQTLPEALGIHPHDEDNAAELYIQKSNRPPRKVDSDDPVLGSGPISISPDGRFAIVATGFHNVPRSWNDYKSLQAQIRSAQFDDSFSPLHAYRLLRLKDRAFTRLVGAPMPNLEEKAWSQDGGTLYLKTFLPLNIADPTERAARAATERPVAIQLSDCHVQGITDTVWKTVMQKPGPISDLEISLEEDVSTPPKLFVSSRDHPQKSLLLDLNPQFARLEFGKTETVTWIAHGIEVTGGLYFPSGYIAGKRYPLVIQTHGYFESRFSMDGMNEWNSAFAARPIAAKGFIVLQTYNFKRWEDHDRVGEDRSLGANNLQAFRTFASLVYDSAIDFLDERGMIDVNRVGISGFSRTVWFVAYTLTHARHTFKAAVLTDGVNAGYFEYLAYRQKELETDNGGEAPFGDGLSLWLKESPDFNLAKVRVPVRLVALNRESLFDSWEWFAGLTLQGKPVDLVEIPDGSHILQKPQDRQIAMQGLVDWFCFWLQGNGLSNAVDDDGTYMRWNKLLHMRDPDGMSLQ